MSLGVLFLLSAEYSSNMRGLASNLGDLTVASTLPVTTIIYRWNCIE